MLALSLAPLSLEAISAGIFVAALAVIAFEWAHRTKVALAGAGLMMLIGSLELDGAIQSVDWATLGLLVGMMLLVGLTERTGVFSYLALSIARLSRGRPLRLLFLLAGTTGVLSAFLDNLTAILLVVPVTLLIAQLVELPAWPLVIAEILASNIGGTATLIGDPPNIMIGTRVPELSFNDFIVNLAPVAFLTLLVVTTLLYVIFRPLLRIDGERAETLKHLDPAAEMKGKRYVKRSLFVLVGTIILFFLHAQLHLEPAVVALLGATVLLLITGDNIEKALERIDWATIFFFVGLFVMVGGLEEQGVIDDVAAFLRDVSGGSAAGEAMAILWGAAIGSALVDNIPFTAAMLPVVEGLTTPGEPFNDTNWWALALGACFGGNATLIAAAANVAGAGVAARHGEPISFGRFLVIGVPVTFVSLLIATAYLLLFQV
jgi:Na+/H+ antiporter NhaD/arsenite permease-like protein